MSTKCDQCGVANPADIHTCTSATEESSVVRSAAPAQPVQPAAWRDAIAVNLLREGINKHRARELADHFIGLTTPPAQPEPVQPLAWAEYNFKEGKFTGLTTDDMNSVDSVGTWCQWVPQLQALAAQPAVPEVCCGEYKTCVKACVPRGVFLGQQKAAAQTAPVQTADIAALVEGMEVSIDVSTGDHDSGNRLFGTVTLAQENQGSKHGLILLVQDPEANFKTTAPPAQPAVQEPVASLKEVDVLMMAEAHGIDPSTNGLYGFYIDCISNQPAAQPAPCTWTKSNDPHMPDTFNATCGVVWTFTDGGPAENDVRFCPGCGAAVSVADPEPEEDLFDLAVKADNGGQP